MLDFGLSNIAIGGITGLVGGIAQKVADYKLRKLELEDAKNKRDHEIKLQEAEAQIMKEEWAQRTKIAEVEADAKTFEVSHEEPELYSEKVKPTKGQGWLLVLVDFLRGIVRPFLTIYLVTIVSVMYYRTDGGQINAQSVADTVLFLATTAVCWWFGSRGMKK